MHHACYFVGHKGEVCIFDARYCGEHQVSVGLFVCLFGVFHPTRGFFTHMETSPLPLKAANFDLCSAIEQ